MDRMRTQVYSSMSCIPPCQQQHAGFPSQPLHVHHPSRLTELTQLVEAKSVTKGVPVLLIPHSCVLPAALIDSGEGLKLVAALLERLLADKGAGAAKEAWTATGLSLLDFAPKASALLRI